MTGRFLFFLTPACTTEPYNPQHPQQTVETSCATGVFTAEGWPYDPPQCRGCTLSTATRLLRVLRVAEGLLRVPSTHPQHLSAQLRGPKAEVCGGCGGWFPLLGERAPRKNKKPPAAGYGKSQVVVCVGVVGLPVDLLTAAVLGSSFRANLSLPLEG